MCTAVTYKTHDHYFGRNLDLSYCYEEKVVVMPRYFPVSYRKVRGPKKQYAMIGMATVSEGYPLFYEATNEKGLSMAGLNFPGNADYKAEKFGMDNVAPFEMIPWILGQCADVSDARRLLACLNPVCISFSPRFSLSPLHWMIADRDCAVTVEPLRDGIRIYENQAGVLTNNPPFEFHVQNLNHYMNLTREEPVNRFSDELELGPNSLGMGAIGLPGDLSSASRFIRAAFTKLNSVSGPSEPESVSQLFHILGAVSQKRGCVRAETGEFERTVYTSCCNTDRGIYYYTTYENSQITGVDMHRENLDGCSLIQYPLITEQQIRMMNEKR